MSDSFNQKSNQELPVIANGVRDVSLSDFQDYLFAEGKSAQGFFVGTGGNVRVKSIDGSEATLKNIASGSFVALRVIKFFNTDTTASDIVAFV